jgi:hypothetical protein
VDDGPGEPGLPEPLVNAFAEVGGHRDGAVALADIEQNVA